MTLLIYRNTTPYISNPMLYSVNLLAEEKEIYIFLGIQFGSCILLFFPLVSEAAENRFLEDTAMDKLVF